jgi:signal peptidase I
MTQHELTAWVPPGAPPKRRIGRIVFWVLFVIAAATLAGGVALSIGMTRLYSIPSTSMENTLRPGDLAVASRGASARRGDVVVIRAPLPGSAASGLFVRRLIGLPGDRVACCDSEGRVTVNGEALEESAYVYPGDRPSTIEFSVTLGNSEVWVLGDHRSNALDSRFNGPVPASRIVGRVLLIRRGGSYVTVRTPSTFVADGLAPADTRSAVPALALILVCGSALALLILGITGTTRFMIRRRRSKREPRLFYAA